MNRLVTAHDNYGNSTRVYTYDTLGNLTLETGLGSHNTDYLYNNLNQQTDRSSDNWKSHTTFTYDKRGNLIQEQYGKNKKVTNIGTYTYDETNKMVKGVNANAESSSYLYNGLGALVEQTWVIAKNSYGYHDVTAEAAAPIVAEPEAASDSADSPETPVASDGTAAEPEVALDELLTESADQGIMLLSSSKKDNSGKKPSDKPTGNDVKKTSTVVKQFVVDYTTETFEPLMEHEVNGLDYRYVYGNDRLSVNITGVENGSSKLIENGNQIRLYYHMDYLGTADYLTSPLTGKVESWTHYNEWGEITHNAVLKCGQRELDLVKRYATHDFDAVLNLYYAKARFFDAENRRFAAVDPILDAAQYDITKCLSNPVQLVQYLYVVGNPLIYVDPLGYAYVLYMKNKEGSILAEKELDFTKYTGKGLLHIREVAELISQAGGYYANVNYDEDTNSVSFDVEVGRTSYNMSVNIDDMDKAWQFGLGNQVESNEVYFNHYDCLGNDKTLVDINSLGQKLGVTFEIVYDENYGWRFVGAGLQFELTVNVPNWFAGILGAEAIFFTDMNLEGNSTWYIPDVYVYHGIGVGGDPSSLVGYLTKTPNLLSDSMSKAATVSGAVFAVFGNEDFKSVNDYEGGFKALSGTFAGNKLYVSWSGSCKVVGIGKDTNTFGISYSETDYLRIAGEEGLTDDFYALASQIKATAESISLPG